MPPLSAVVKPILALALLGVPSGRLPAATVLDLAVEDVPTILGSSPGDRLGHGLDVGDLDGDGRNELVVAAPGADAPGTGVDAGVVYVFDAESVSRSDRASTAADAALAITGSHALEGFGETVCVADLNGDSRPDLIVGAPAWGRGDDMFAGRVYVFFGPLTQRGSLMCETVADAVIRGTRAGDRLGSSIVVADVRGGGTAELLVSAFRAAGTGGVRAGSVYVISSRSLAGGRTVAAVRNLASSELRGESEGDALRGIAVAAGANGAPAVVALGAYQADGPEESTDAGKIYLVRGDLIASIPLHSSIEIDAPVVLGPHPRALFGRSIASGDIDGDGRIDFAASAYASRAHRAKVDASGEVFVIYGSDAPPPDVLDLSVADVPRFRSSARWDLFGLPVLLRDMNADGRADLIASAQFADFDDGARKRCGKVYLYRGGPRSVVAAKTGKADLADLIIVGGSPFDAIGGALAAGAITGDRPDLIIGAPEAGKALPAGPGDETSEGMVMIVPASLLQAR